MAVAVAVSLAVAVAVAVVVAVAVAVALARGSWLWHVARGSLPTKYNEIQSFWHVAMPVFGAYAPYRRLCLYYYYVLTRKTSIGCEDMALARETSCPLYPYSLYPC